MFIREQVMFVLQHCCLSNLLEIQIAYLLFYTLCICCLLLCIIYLYHVVTSLVSYIPWTCEAYMMYVLEMANTRMSGLGGENHENLQPPPPISMEQLLMMHTQLM
jgi:hypothetical protein